MSETTNQQMPNRSQRRKAMKFQGFLKQKGKLSLTEWSKICKETAKHGKEIHTANVDAVDKYVYSKLEAVENIKIAKWKEEGYTDKEIEQLREAYSLIMIKDKTTWHTDKKIARKTIKELSLKLQARS